MRAVCDPAASQHGYRLRLIDHRRQDLVERPCGLHVSASFGTLADEIVRANVEGAPGAGDVADLNSHLRARVPDGRDVFQCRNAPCELNDRRPSVERDRKRDRIEC